MINKLLISLSSFKTMECEVPDVNNIKHCTFVLQKSL